MLQSLKIKIFESGWFWVIFAVFLSQIATAQNVGIGTENPLEALHVLGTTRSTHFYATHTIRADQRISINAVANNSYRLLVNNGNSRLNGNLEATGSVGIGGDINPAFKLNVDGLSRFAGNTTTVGNALITGNLNVYGSGGTGSNFAVGNNLIVSNDAIIDNNFRVNGRVGINGATSAGYGLFVNNSNSFFQGNTITSGNATIQGNQTVNGNTSLQGNVSIKGNGHVRSNGPSSLLVGFSSKSVNINIPASGTVNIDVNLPAFDNINDIRIDINHFEPSKASGGFFVNMLANFRWYIYDVDPASNSCKIRIKNDNTSQDRPINGTFYLTTTQRE